MTVFVKETPINKLILALFLVIAEISATSNRLNREEDSESEEVLSLSTIGKTKNYYPCEGKNNDHTINLPPDGSEVTLKLPDRFCPTTWYISASNGHQKVSVSLRKKQSEEQLAVSEQVLAAYDGHSIENFISRTKNLLRCSIDFDCAKDRWTGPDALLSSSNATVLTYHPPYQLKGFLEKGHVDPDQFRLTLSTVFATVRAVNDSWTHQNRPTVRRQKITSPEDEFRVSVAKMVAIVIFIVILIALVMAFTCYFLHRFYQSFRHEREAAIRGNAQRQQTNHGTSNLAFSMSQHQYQSQVVSVITPPVSGGGTGRQNHYQDETRSNPPVSTMTNETTESTDLNDETDKFGIPPPPPYSEAVQLPQLSFPPKSKNHLTPSSD